MFQTQLDNFLNKLAKEYQIHAPILEGKEVFVRSIEEVLDIDLSGRVPINSYKEIFLPQEEVIYTSQSNKVKLASEKPSQIVAFGLNVLDLKALALFDQVFEKDPYYQKRRANILVIGFSQGLPKDYQRYKVFSLKYEEDVLEHLIFDIFIERQTNGNFKFFSGSRQGQAVLEKYGLKDYEHIEFAGLVSEDGPDKRMMKIRKKLAASKNNKLWQELDERCLACGKCTLICPTCFCFDLADEPQFNSVKRTRKWGVCFYPEFSEIAGDIKFLKTIKDKIFFWYYHKFVRIPDEFSMPGCVSCNRCTKVCPVGIDIQKNIQKILKAS